MHCSKHFAVVGSLLMTVTVAVPLAVLSASSTSSALSAFSTSRQPAGQSSGQPSPDDVVAFRNVAVFDGARLIRRTTVLVRDGMIHAIGPDTVIPPAAQIVEGDGKTLMPGLIDAHTHLGMTFGEQFLQDALRFGVTTELEMWGAATSFTLRNEPDSSSASRNRADLRTAGTGVTVPKGHPTHMGGPPFPMLGPDDDAQAFVDARIAEGSDYIKIIFDRSLPTLTPQQLAAIVAAGHRRNRLVVAHALTQRDARDAIAAGVDGLVHIFADSSPGPDFAEMAARHQIFVVPTLSVVEAVTQPREAQPQGTPPREAQPPSTQAPDALSLNARSLTTPWWQNAPATLTSRITPAMRQSLERKLPPGYGAHLKLAHAQAAVRALHQAGVPILAGTDAPAPGLAHGLSMHRELELLVLSGLTPAEALAAATSRTARAFGFHDRGRIAPGLRADLLLVNGDPAADIRATRDIAGIWKLGARCACSITQQP